MQKTRQARLPRSAFKSDLREVLGPLKKYPHLVDSFIKNNVPYDLTAIRPGKYIIFKNKGKYVMLENEFEAQRAFDDLRESL